MKECCWLPYLEMCKLCIQDLGHVLYAVVIVAPQNRGVR